MSAPDPECVVCGRAALDLSGRDGGFPAYREFRALWDPPKVFQGMIHFSCLRDWKHREEMLTELVDLATDTVLEFDVEVEGQTHHLTRRGLGYTVRRFETEDILVLQHHASTDWLIVDFAGSWQFIGRKDLFGLVRGERVYAVGGRGRYGLTLTPAPDESVVSSWVLADLLQHLDIDDRYPGLAASDANLRVDAYNADSGWLEYTVNHPLSIHPTALAYFRNEYKRDGESAFTSLDTAVDE